MTTLSNPQYSAKKQSEQKSLMIIEDKLHSIGVVRRQTDCDFGVDLELELKRGQDMIGKFMKIQVKSSQNLRYKKNGSPSISGIKQSTLNYWCQIAFDIPVIACAVDLQSEEAYVTSDLFWQAAKNIDGTGSTKTISFETAIGDGTLDQTFIVYCVAQAFAPTMNVLVKSHKIALRRYESFLGLLVDAYHYDPGTELDSSLVEELLDVCRDILFFGGRPKFDDENDAKYWSSVDYWRRKSSRQGFDEIACYSSRELLLGVLLALHRKLRRLRDDVISSRYFWKRTDPSYLKLVHSFPFEDIWDLSGLRDLSDNFDRSFPLPSYESEIFLASIP